MSQIPLNCHFLRGKQHLAMSLEQAIVSTDLSRDFEWLHVMVISIQWLTSVVKTAFGHLLHHSFALSLRSEGSALSPCRRTAVPPESAHVCGKETGPFSSACRCWSLQQEPWPCEELGEREKTLPTLLPPGRRPGPRCSPAPGPARTQPTGGPRR